MLWYARTKNEALNRKEVLGVKLYGFFLGRKASPDEIESSNMLRLRTKHVLKTLGVSTVEGAAALTKEQILEVPYAGKYTLPDIEAFLAEHGRHLSPSS
jgi:hypothetical protein